jgi:hypothetical protein
MNEIEIRQLLAEAGIPAEEIARWVPAAQLMARMDPALVRAAVLQFIEQSTDE